MVTLSIEIKTKSGLAVDVEMLVGMVARSVTSSKAR